MLSENNSLIIDSSFNNSIILKKTIRVNSSKLPSDFFHSRQLNRHELKRMSLKRSAAKETTRQTSTPTFERDYQVTLNNGRPSILSERKIESARANMNKDDTLINEVISTARNLRRVLRKKSLQMVRQSVRYEEPSLQLPHIKKQRLGNLIF